jgi:osmotically-inducible protein OsmY
MYFVAPHKSRNMIAITPSPYQFHYPELMAYRAILAFLLTISFATAYPQHKGSRYDEQIRTAVTDILTSEKKFGSVQATVEDNVVTLKGSVLLDSTRERLVGQVKHIKHVHSVRNELVLDPPAPPDVALYGHVRQTLADIRLENITCKVHEGSVILSGIVRDEKERQRAIEMVRSTAGVKEVQSQLRVAEN